MAKKEQKSPVEDKSIEEVFRDLEGILARLEDSSVSLEDSFRIYTEGMHLVKAAGDKIDRVEKSLTVLENKAAKEE